MKITKIVVLCLIPIFLISFGLASCKAAATTTTSAETTETTTTTEATTTTAAETTAAEQPVTITIWDWQAGAPAYDAALKEINDLYHQKHPNVTIDRKAYNSAQYGDLIKTAIQSNTLPDLFGLYQGSSMQSVADTGILFEWDDAINADPEWKANLGKNYGIGGTLDRKTGKIIATSYDIFYILSFGYRNVLEKMGSSQEEVLNLKTYKDLANLCQKFKKAGNSTWYLAGGLQQIHWLQENFYTWVYSVSKDPNTIYDAEFGKTSWTGEPFIAAADAIRDTSFIMREDVLSLNAQTDGYNQWLNQEAWGSWYNGPWAVGALLDYPEDLKNIFAFTKPPIVEGGLKDYMAADAGQVLSMTKDNPKKDQILEYAKFLATPEVSAIFLKNLIHPFGKFPDNWQDVIPGDAKDFFIEMVQLYQKGNIGPWIIYTGDINKALIDNLTAIFQGKQTSMEGMQKMDEVTKAYWESHK